jgi:hypothetical protein
MNIFSWILIGLLGASLLLGAHEHGKPKTGTNNFWITLLAVAIEACLFWGAGLFG